MDEIPNLIPEGEVVEVWLPLAFNRPLSYLNQSSQKLKPGMRVVVPLRGKKMYTAFVWSVNGKSENGAALRPLVEILDEQPFLNGVRMQFLEWMASYYCCSLGEVLLAAIPAPFRLSSESFVHFRPDADWVEDEMSSEELWLFRILKKKGKAALTEILAGFSSPSRGMRMIRHWQEENKILVLDEITEKNKSRTAFYLTLNLQFRGETEFENLFTLLEKRPEEESLILRFLNKTGFGKSGGGSWELQKEELNLNPNERKALAWLIRKGILKSERRKINSFFSQISFEGVSPVLSLAQQKAYQEIKVGFDAKKTVLLMGVTGSGKTEVYIQLISETLKNGRQALLMLPEIGITIQIVSRLQQVFGDSMGVYHSRNSISEKLEVWEGIETQKLSFVVGVRSSVFLPFSNLGLIVVDEEHDSSYKQAEPAPRYQGRDSAIYLSRLFNANILLGSATPAIESYHHAAQGKWHFVKLEERFGNAFLPEIRFVDTRKAQRTLTMKLDFSDEVLENLKRAKQVGKQGIIFQNRRGYSPFIECGDCGWIPYCPQCDVSLTYHQSRHSLNCHYCGHHAESPRQCLECGSVNLQTPGYGTEKLEESLGHLLPELRVARMDQDTTGSRKNFEHILNQMHLKEIDVLVGTQMVTKGLDFENVTLVAVFDIDRVLHYPEFRANERTFQLLSQISGRAGRRTDQGLVLVQTHVPHHPLYRMIAGYENQFFYETEIDHRRRYEYPPFSRLIRVTARHPEQQIAFAAIESLASKLKKALGSEMILGPEAPVIARLRNQFIFNLYLKILPIFSLAKVKDVLRSEVLIIQSEKEWKKVQWILDVDPN